MDKTTKAELRYCLSGPLKDLVEIDVQNALRRSSRIGRELSGANTEQRRRARMLLRKWHHVYGWYSAEWCINLALEKFDAEIFDDPLIARWLNDNDLDLAMGTIPFRVRGDGKIKFH